MNELIVYKSWWSRHWKWLVPLAIVIIAGIGIIGSSKVGENTTHIIKAYTEASLHENAIAIAQNNNEVMVALGKIEPIDKFALLEGGVRYSNNYESAELHVRIKGDKGRGKIDIYAFKQDGNWHYKTINIRVREPKQTIIVL